MRLLHCKSVGSENKIYISLKEPTPIPPYAILSHRWTDEEVSFATMINDYRDPTMNKGYAKVEGLCRQAMRDGYYYVWLDTCCIDKTSSAELSEAINSMYSWYERSGMCYAYLQDVSSDEDPGDQGSSFRRSAWFTRGWTLQEMIAPKAMVFLAADWIEIGSRSRLAEVIEEITGVETRALLLPIKSQDFSVRKKMSWAVGRKTTRLEDRAYSLMGLLNVNMPIIYGEGTKSFVRLQEELIRISDDQSILAWDTPRGSFGGEFGPLATSPDDFTNTIDARPMSYKEFKDMFRLSDGRADYRMTNFGLRIHLPLEKVQYWDQTIFHAYIACSSSTKEILYVYLAPIVGKPPGHFRRIVTPLGDETKSIGYAKHVVLNDIQPTDIFIATEDPRLTRNAVSITDSKRWTFRVRLTYNCRGFDYVDYYPKFIWKLGEREGNPVMIVTSETTLRLGAILFCHKTSEESFSVILGVHRGLLWSDIAVTDKNATALSICNAYENRNEDRWKVRLQERDWVKKRIGTTVEGLEKSVVSTITKGYNDIDDIHVDVSISMRYGAQTASWRLQT